MQVEGAVGIAGVHSDQAVRRYRRHAHSEFVGRRAGDEGKTVALNLDKYGLVAQQSVSGTRRADEKTPIAPHPTPLKTICIH